MVLEANIRVHLWLGCSPWAGGGHGASQGLQAHPREAQAVTYEHYAYNILKCIYTCFFLKRITHFISFKKI